MGFLFRSKHGSKRSRIRRITRWTILTFGLAILVTFIWYVWNRVQSGSRAVKRYQRQDATITAPPEQRPDVLRVGIYNVAHGRGDAEYGQHGIWENLVVNLTGGSSTERIERLNSIGNYLDEQNLDIIILNEVDFRVFWSGNVNQATYIAERTGHPYILEQRNHDLDLPFLTIKFGNAVLSRYPIVASSLLEYPAYRWWENMLLGRKKGAICELELPDGTYLRVAPVHLDVRSTEVRLESVEILAELANRRPERPLIVAGDFNSTRPEWPGAEPNDKGVTAVSYLLENGFTTHSNGAQPEPHQLTFASSDPVKVIDWVLVTSPLEVRENTVGQVSHSDHFPVIATITLPARLNEDE